MIFSQELIDLMSYYNQGNTFHQLPLLDIPVEL